MTKDTHYMLNRLQGLGFDPDEAFSLRRIAMIFGRWNELECGTGNANWTFSIERNEQGKPFYRRQGWMNGQWYDGQTPTPDREKGAQKRLARIMAKHPELIAYEQGDPRGASLYIVRKSDLNGCDINSCYTRGVAVYK